MILDIEESVIDTRPVPPADPGPATEAAARVARRPVLAVRGSPAAAALADLAPDFDVILFEVGEASPHRGPAVLVLDVQPETPMPVWARADVARSIAVVGFLPPGGGEVPDPADDWYALLPRDAPRVVRAVTLGRAFEHLTARQDIERFSRELRELNAIGIRLSAERDLTRLLDLILTKAREITQSDAGSLYLVEDDDAGERRLRFALAQNDSRAVPFTEFTIPLNVQSVAGYVALTGDVINLADAYFPPAGATYRINRSFDSQIDYRTKSMLVVPMRTPKNEIIGVLQLINCKPDPHRRLGSVPEIEREVVPFDARHADFAGSLASQAAVAVANSRLYESIHTLFEGFVKASVTAIEARDPTTSGHSFRVADLTVGLAEAVDRTATGPYGDVRFTSDEMKEIRYASLLHDFGKVGVREEVLVKSKKLHAHQIDTIRQRVELIRRSLELRHSRRKIDFLLREGREGFAEHARQLDAELEPYLAELDESLARIIEANEPTVVARDFTAAIHRIALRTFEDHVGLPQLILTPEEARILSVSKGSLTESERRQIQSHVLHTFRFLAQIPWTREIGNIPLIAGSHHEKLDGSGYPRGLRSEQIPLQSKIMTIADIFDALTSGDRPYKRGVPAETALDLLAEERRAGTIDSALLDLFVDARIFERTQAGLRALQRAPG
jgi:HD-GYP domain-containing protein (c-di-GMP phosphodiesterase class II)